MRGVPGSFLCDFRYNERSMFKTLLFLSAAALLTAINITLGCFIAIRLGYGPPNWQTALNLLVRLTTLQDYLNAGREWLEKKVPKVDKLLTRLPIPKPIIIIDTSPIEEEEEEEEEVKEESVKEEQIDDEIPTAVPDESAGEQAAEPTEAELPEEAVNVNPPT